MTTVTAPSPVRIMLPPLLVTPVLAAKQPSVDAVIAFTVKLAESRKETS